MMLIFPCRKRRAVIWLNFAGRERIRFVFKSASNRTIKQKWENPSDPKFTWKTQIFQGVKRTFFNFKFQKKEFLILTYFNSHSLHHQVNIPKSTQVFGDSAYAHCNIFYS